MCFYNLLKMLDNRNCIPENFWRHRLFEKTLTGEREMLWSDVPDLIDLGKTVPQGN